MSLRVISRERLVVAATVAFCVPLLAFARPAAAAPGFRLVGHLEPPGGFSSPHGVAVNNGGGLFGGSVYVADRRHGLVDRFSSTNGWEGITATFPGGGPEGIAVDDSPLSPQEGDVYVVGEESSVVYRYSPSLELEQEIHGVSLPESVAVDSAGHLLVGEDSGAILEFSATGEPLDASGNPSAENTVIEGPSIPFQLAVTPSDEVMIASSSGTFRYLLSGGAYTPLETLPGTATGVAVTASGDILTDDGSEVLDRAPNGSLEGQFGPFEEGFNLALSASTHDIYVAASESNAVDIYEEGVAPEVPVTDAATPHGPTSFLLRGELTGGGTSYYFEYNTGGTCEGGSRTSATPGGSGAVSAELTKLEGSQAYTFCLVATGEFGSATGVPQTFDTGSIEPIVTDPASSGVSGHSATLTAQIDPENLPGTYHFEYSPADMGAGAHAARTSDVAYGAAHTSVATAHLEGLVPAQEYHFRAFATNTNGEVGSSGEGSFRTLSTSAGLPDGRVYEMVSPPDNQNADVSYPFAIRALPLNEGDHTELPFAVAEDGSAVAYIGGTTTGGDGKAGQGLGNQYLATRGEGGWVQRNIQPNGRLLTYYQGFSPNLSSAVLGQDFNPTESPQPLSAEAPTEGAGGLYVCNVGAEPCATPGAEEPGAPYTLLSERPLNRLGPAFSTSENGFVVPTTYQGGAKGPLFAGGSEDFSSLLFEANDALPGVTGPIGTALDESAKAEIAHGEANDYLYDRVGGHLTLVDVLPDGHVSANATFGGSTGAQPDFSRVISADGRRVFWTDLNTGVVYARVDNTSTIAVSEGAARAMYWTASKDGRYVFYTEGAGAQSTLHRFDFEMPEGSRQTEITEPGAGVLGVIGASNDGHDVYFVAEGALATAPNGEGQKPSAGQPNVYLWRSDGETVFVTTLESADGESVKPFSEAGSVFFPGMGDWRPGLGDRTAEVTGDGSGVVFMSTGKVPVAGYPNGYENRGNEEVYIYQAAANHVFCVSCSDTGEPAPGGASGAAGFVPIGWNPTILPQWASEDGNKVFFDSAVPLSSHATNGRINVYEWERESVGSCKPAQAVNGGCVYLISDGATESASWLIGASSRGNDVFFVTRARLAADDQNDADNLFDARVGGSVPPGTPACTGAGCQGNPPQAPAFAIPPTSSSVGPGNFASQGAPTTSPPKHRSLSKRQKLARALRLCRKQPPRKRRACEAVARRRFATAKTLSHAHDLGKGRPRV